MGHRHAIAALALLGLSGSSFAFYSGLGPPPGWTGGGWTNGGAAVATYQAPSGSAWNNGVARASGTLNLGGRTASVPAGMKLADSAGKFLAGRIGALGMGGPLGVGVSVAGALLLPPLIDWMAEAAVRYNKESNTWEKQTPDSRFRWTGRTGTGTYFSASEACAVEAPPGVTYTPRYNSDSTSASCMDGDNSYGTVQRSATPAFKWEQADFETEVKPELERTPLPKRTPEYLPSVGWPVELPVINPGDGLILFPNPYKLPQGDPVEVPDTDPQQYKQPVVRVDGSPTKDEPWRVNLTPEDVKTTDPKGVDPNAPPESQNPDETAEEKEADLCEKNPDILACAKVNLGELDAEDLKNTDVPLKLDKDQGFPSGGQCPAAKVLPLLGQSFTFSMQPLCDFASMIKPLLIGFAWLAAAMTFLGVARRD